MDNVQSSLEMRVDQLAEDLRLLTARVDDFDRRGQVAAPWLDHETTTDSADEPVSNPTADLLKQLTGATLLATIATVCFLLAIALVLRTLVDSNVINQTVGAYFGLSYAVGMMAYGVVRYAKAHRPIPIYITCGLVMLFAIILETHIRFEVIPSSIAYLLLAGCIVATTIFGKRYHVPSVLAFGILGATSAGLALDFPHPIYSLLGPLVLLGTVAAYSASNTLQWRWVSWAAFVFEAMFFMMWMLKARAILLNPDISGHPTTISWYLPIVAAFFGVHAVLALWGAIRRNWPLGYYERAMPSLAGVYAFGLAWAFIGPWNGRVDFLGLAGVVVAVGFSCIAMWLSTRESKECRAAPAWMFAVLLMFALGTPSAFQSLPLTFVLWAAVAFGTDSLADRWGSSPLRCAAWAFQTFTCAVAAASGVLLTVTPLTPARLVGLLIVAGICLAHYIRYRSIVTQESDRVGNAPLILVASLALLFYALTYMFGISRSLLFYLLSVSPLDVDITFQCSQSMLINGSALCASVIGLIRRDRHLILAALILAGIGATKLFGFDLVHCQGLPLVINVTLFGITAATGSIVWKRWQRLTSNDPAENPGYNAAEKS